WRTGMNPIKIGSPNAVSLQNNNEIARGSSRRRCQPHATIIDTRALAPALPVLPALPALPAAPACGKGVEQLPVNQCAVSQNPIARGRALQPPACTPARCTTTPIVNFAGVDYGKCPPQAEVNICMPPQRVEVVEHFSVLPANARLP